MRNLYLILSIGMLWMASCQPNDSNSPLSSTDTVPLPQTDEEVMQYISEHYTKKEYMIPMRDGIHLFTTVYTPVDTSHTYPLLIKRTPYSCAPYGEENYPEQLGNSTQTIMEGFIFVIQDVRGRFMSEGTFQDMPPYIEEKQDSTDIDESSDAYDTIDWLIANIAHNNGSAGIYGNSYPGYYAAMAAVDAHPALKISIPQCPVGDWFWDDFRHHGAFFLPHFFNFFQYFGPVRPEPVKEWPAPFLQVPDSGFYDYYLNEVGALSNVNDKFYKNRIAFWDSVSAHPDYDKFWQDRSIFPAMKNVTIPVMTVMGLFDAEDLYGPLHIYEAIEKNSSSPYNILVAGPWRHGGYARTDGASLGDVYFGDSTSAFYLQQIELPVLTHFLKSTAAPDLPEAFVYNTGQNEWKQFSQWPPAAAEFSLYLQQDGSLSENQGNGKRSFVSDPANPVPYSTYDGVSMQALYMIEDQRFVADRPDVLVYKTEVLTEDITLSGKAIADLYVSTTGTDADWVVKIIDVYPDNHPGFPELSPKQMGGFQQMVRSEIFRGRYRKSYSEPEPFVAGEVSQVKFELQDVLHTFKAGHRIMIQIQSSWFPLADRNPQKYVDNIYKAHETDFTKATHTVYCTPEAPSAIHFKVFRE